MKHIERAVDSAERLRKRHDLSEAQEHVLRGLMIGLPHARLRDFDGIKLSLKTIEAHQAKIMEQIGVFGRLEFKIMRWLGKRALRHKFGVIVRGGAPSQP